MARQLRLEFEGALYHLTARGNARQPIFQDDTDRQQFLELLGRETLQQRWRCSAYCLMDNHYHLLVETPEANLSRGMRRLNASYTQRFNRRHGRVGHVLQGRFKSLLVEKESYLLELCRYLVLNPVRAAMVETAADWRWSSYRATVGDEPAPPWLDAAGVLVLFAPEPKAARRAYRQFVQAGIGHPSPWSQVKGQIFLGSAAFLQRMESLIQGQRLANVPAAQTQPTRLRPDEVLARVAAVYGVNARDMLERVHTEAYYSAAWLLRRSANEPLALVARRFGVSPSRISKIQRAVECTIPSPQRRRAMRECQVKQ
ncbi:MAG: REP-associated tyrosine transposase [Nitrospiraceae bacterium]